MTENKLNNNVELDLYNDITKINDEISKKKFEIIHLKKKLKEKKDILYKICQHDWEMIKNVIDKYWMCTKCNAFSL